MWGRGQKSGTNLAEFDSVWLRARGPLEGCLAHVRASRYAQMRARPWRTRTHTIRAGLLNWRPAHYSTIQSVKMAPHSIGRRYTGAMILLLDHLSAIIIVIIIIFIIIILAHWPHDVTRRYCFSPFCQRVSLE